MKKKFPKLTTIKTTTLGNLKLAIKILNNKYYTTQTDTTGNISNTMQPIIL